MFGTNVLGRGLTFGKVLSGLSRGLSIANQAIPLYQQVKPMIGNARKLMSVVKEFKNAAPIKEKSIIETTAKETKKDIKKVSNAKLENSSMPVFFQ